LPNSANGVKISPDNRTVAVTSDNSSVYFFAPPSEEVRGEITPIKEVSLFNPTAQSISWDPTSRYVAFACEGDNSCVVYDMELKKIIRRYLRPVRTSFNSIYQIYFLGSFPTVTFSSSYYKIIAIIILY
jgi:WD40 repeat protein